MNNRSLFTVSTKQTHSHIHTHITPEYILGFSPFTCCCCWWWFQCSWCFFFCLFGMAVCQLFFELSSQLTWHKGLQLAKMKTTRKTSSNNKNGNITAILPAIISNKTKCLFLFFLFFFWVVYFPCCGVVVLFYLSVRLSVCQFVFMANMVWKC